MPKSGWQVKAKLVRIPDSETPDLYPRPRLNINNIPSELSESDQNKHNRAESGEQKDVETTE